MPLRCLVEDGVAKDWSEEAVVRFDVRLDELGVCLMVAMEDDSEGDGGGEFESYVSVDCASTHSTVRLTCERRECEVASILAEGLAYATRTAVRTGGWCVVEGFMGWPAFGIL